MPFLKAVTGKGVTTAVAAELTDLGIMRWDPDRNCIAALFGDSFSFGWGQDWRSPIIIMYGADFDVLGVPVKGGVATAPARQLWDYGHNNKDFSTVLPCDFIRVGSTWFVAVMLTQGLGNETMTEFWQSQDLIDWQLSGFGFPHPVSDPCTTMLSFDQFGDDIYIVGTHGLRRDGPIKMWKTHASQFPRGYWEPCGVIREGRHGELCLRNVQGNAVLSFFDELNYKQTALTVAHPDDDWSDANQVDYVTGTDLPQLYGGYIAPNSRLNEPNGMTFFVSQWVTATNSPYHVVAYTDTLHAKGPLEQERPTVTAVLASSVAANEKVLQYDHSQQVVAQEKFWDCGPASTQIVLNGLGVHMSEDQLIRELGTTTDGTNTVEQALPVLNRETKGRYTAVWMPTDPPSREQRDMLWRNITSSIDAGYGCVLNFEVPSSNFPRGTRGSVSPAYRGAKIWHYVACMGYADDGPGGKHVWIADPGFQPFGYWMALEQCATAIPPHAYAYATVKSETVSVVPPPHEPTATPQVGYSSRSGYRNPGEGAIGDIDQFVLNDDSLLHQLWVEWSATMAGDPEAIYRIVRAAAGKGADTSPAFIRRARALLKKVPVDELATALAAIEQADPELLKAVVV